MGNLFHRESEACRSFRDALEELPVKSGAGMSAEEWLAELPVQDAEHAGSCTACREALEEFAETRRALAGMPSVEAGPWFTARVMAAIGAREKEEEIERIAAGGRRELGGRADSPGRGEGGRALRRHGI
jgi:hypothetical protein